MRGHGVWLLVMLAWPAWACAQKPEQCRSWASDSMGTGFSQCGDGKIRSVDCPRATSPEKVRVCVCKLDSAKGKTFELADPDAFNSAESATKVVNQNCGWNISR
ncbi:MAG: hypothetical protein U0263_02600 [Polyangiaceae bacterium]